MDDRILPIADRIVYQYDRLKMGCDRLRICLMQINWGMFLQIVGEKDDISLSYHKLKKDGGFFV